MEKVIKKYKLNPKIVAASRKNFPETFSRLKETYPKAHCALNHKNALELLVATILSAQCTDKRVNMVTPELFKKYPNAAAFARANLEKLQSMIRSTGFYRNKAKNIISSCQTLTKEFGGVVPDKMLDLLKLAGVARKTANVVLWNAFGKNEGVVVDTHVQRTSQRLGWTANEQPIKIECDLMDLVPQQDWGMLAHYLIDLGRDVCKAPAPDCKRCQLCDLCPWFKNVISKSPKWNTK